MKKKKNALLKNVWATAKVQFGLLYNSYLNLVPLKKGNLKILLVRSEWDDYILLFLGVGKLTTMLNTTRTE